MTHTLRLLPHGCVDSAPRPCGSVAGRSTRRHCWFDYRVIVTRIPAFFLSPLPPHHLTGLRFPPVYTHGSGRLVWFPMPTLAFVGTVGLRYHIVTFYAFCRRLRYRSLALHDYLHFTTGVGFTLQFTYHIPFGLALGFGFHFGPRSPFVVTAHTVYYRWLRPACWFAAFGTRCAPLERFICTRFTSTCGCYTLYIAPFTPRFTMPPLFCHVCCC